MVSQDPAEFCSHSFRSGGATWAFRMRGVPGKLAKIHPWLPQVFRFLIRTNSMINSLIVRCDAFWY